MTVWQSELEVALRSFIGNGRFPGLDPRHTEQTPARVVRAYEAMLEGYRTLPQQHLTALFPSTSDAMVHVEAIKIHSTCAHHLQPIIGIAHFAYLPAGAIVGLSKIPRFIGVLSNRLQVQEELCAQIVDVFQECVKPAGCALWMKAIHCCMSTRGVAEHDAKTKTMALRGSFRTNAVARGELLAAINQHAPIIG